MIAWLQQLSRFHLSLQAKRKAARNPGGTIFGSACNPNVLQSLQLIPFQKTM
jgi:hypothetical protein